MCVFVALSDGSSRPFPVSVYVYPGLLGIQGMMVLGKLQCVDAAAVYSGPFGGMGGSWGGGKQKKRGKSCGWEFPA